MKFTKQEREVREVVCDLTQHSVNGGEEAQWFPSPLLLQYDAHINITSKINL